MTQDQQGTNHLLEWQLEDRQATLGHPRQDSIVVGEDWIEPRLSTSELASLNSCPGFGQDRVNFPWAEKEHS